MSENELNLYIVDLRIHFAVSTAISHHSEAIEYPKVLLPFYFENGHDDTTLATTAASSIIIAIRKRD